MSDTETTAKDKELTLHRLCLIVPLAIQLSVPVIMAEIAIAEKIRGDGPLTIGGYYGVFYFTSAIFSLIWLPLAVYHNQPRLGSAAKYWNALVVIDILLFLLGLGFPKL